MKAWLKRRGGKWVKFLGAGLPAFLLAIPLNLVLVEVVALPMALAYAIVLVMQVTLNFFMCRWLVFDHRSTRSLGADFAVFFAGIAGFRVLDWIVYNLLVYGLAWPYIPVQILNVFVFSFAKFLFSERLFEGRSEPTPRG